MSNVVRIFPEIELDVPVNVTDQNGQEIEAKVLNHFDQIHVQIFRPNNDLFTVLSERHPELRGEMELILIDLQLKNQWLKKIER